MRKRFAIALLTAFALLIALAAPAAGHVITVTNPQTGEVVREGWIGGFTVPEPAQDAPPIFGPLRLPPSHAHGLPTACTNAGGASPAVHIAAPPDFADCVHGP
jgi:hypothetical protein